MLLWPLLVGISIFSSAEFCIPNTNGTESTELCDRKEAKSSTQKLGLPRQRVSHGSLDENFIYEHIHKKDDINGYLVTGRGIAHNSAAPFSLHSPYVFAVNLFSLILILISLWKGKAMLLGWPWDHSAPSGLSPVLGLWSKAHGGCPAKRKIQGGDPQPLGCYRRTPAQVKQCTLNQGREGRGRYLNGTLASFKLCNLHLTDANELLDYFL